MNKKFITLRLLKLFNLKSSRNSKKRKKVIMMYSKPMKIGKLEIKNRFVRSATYEGMAHKGGIIIEKHIELYKNLAKGGVGLIITGYSYAHESGIAFEKQIGIHNDSLIPGLSKIANVVHDYGNGCKILLQIGHCGRQSGALKDTIAPSAILERSTKKIPREMTIKEISENVEAFAQAIRRAKEAGFDGVQLHGAHGYLISSFLSPYTNKRIDEYGGNNEKRMRFIKEIYDKAIEFVGKDFPILIKMNGVDFLKGGVTIEDSKKTAIGLANLGFSALEISGGMWEVTKLKKKELGWRPGISVESRTSIGNKNNPAYNLPFAKEIKKVVDIPIIVVGGINSLDLVEQILNDGNADFVSFCRPLIREPDLPNRWLKGIGSRVVECEFCNGCFASLMDTGIRCIKKELNIQE